MAMSYSTLVGGKSVTGSIRSWQNYDKVDAEGVLEDAQAMIYQSLRVREMRLSHVMNVGTGEAAVDVPAGFLDPMELRHLLDGSDLTQVDERDLRNQRYWREGLLQTGRPTYFAIMDEQLVFDTASDSIYTLELLYYGSRNPLSADTETNFLTRRYPHILRAMCLAMAAEFSHNSEDYARNLQRANGLIAEANAMDELSRRGQFTPAIGA